MVEETALQLGYDDIAFLDDAKKEKRVLPVGKRIHVLYIDFSLHNLVHGLAQRPRRMRDTQQALGVSVRVKLVEPKTIQRSEGKAKRVIDNRDM